MGRLWLSFHASGTLPVDYFWSTQQGTIKWKQRNATNLTWCSYGEPNQADAAQYVTAVNGEGTEACYADIVVENVGSSMENILVWAICQYRELLVSPSSVSWSGEHVLIYGR